VSDPAAVMLYPDDDWTDDQRALRAAAQRFAEQVLRPAGGELDRMPPAAVVARDSALFRAVRQAAVLG
jgi:alkylation response protein AidB-like acyl-CoA dehydrogenase